ncbi:hypothetical protein WA026_006075 [Henosepilachna vigintioctopunctata]|uniref:Uncharacterized protein n=1 Tax=Henosepilachna vigintioctopunctata TaxID=420089 RepID=A0AAW1TJW1_9CUCU
MARGCFSATAGRGNGHAGTRGGVDESRLSFTRTGPLNQPRNSRTSLPVMLCPTGYKLPLITICGGILHFLRGNLKTGTLKSTLLRGTLPGTKTGRIIDENYQIGIADIEEEEHADSEILQKQSKCH